VQIIRKSAYARAGLIGNPSDGYFGKTISIVLRNFSAQVVLYEWDDVEIVWSQEDRSRFSSVRELVQDVKTHGYYGGIRLVKATIKKFVEYCLRQEYELHDRNFSVRYNSNIPRQVGMAGSSAIIVATLRCLMEFYQAEIPPEVRPSLALSVETEELGIAAGLQDRVVQIYEGMVFMDFSKDRAHQVQGYPCGKYEPIALTTVPPLYVAYNTEVGEPTEVVHNDLRARFDQGDAAVTAAMTEFADYAQQARDCLLQNQPEKLGPLLDANFELRRSICPLHPGQVQMVETARSVGATAKFAGSGGAIVGTYEDETMFSCLKEKLGAIHCAVLKPIIAE
jgi:glucuronokinase